MDDQTTWTPGEPPEPRQPAAPAWNAPSTPTAPAGSSSSYGGPSYPGSSYPPPAASSPYAPPDSSPYPPAGSSPYPPAGSSPYPPPAPPAYGGPAQTQYGTTIPASYPQPAPPPYGSAPFAGAAPPPYYPYTVPTGNDGMAVAALVVGIAGFPALIVGPIVAIVLGVVALNRIKQTGRSGRGMARTGIILGSIWIVLPILAAIAIPVVVNERHQALHDACANGDMAACDSLYDTSADGSADQLFGNTCGGRTEGGFLCTSIGDDSYGDDEHLDSLWDACSAGDPAACDELSWSAEPDSEYSQYGLTCGGRTDGSVDCTDVMGKPDQDT